MKEIVSGMNALICSEQGRLIVDEYLAIEKEESQKLNQQVMDALKRHNFKKASFLASSYNAEQVFTVGLGFDWRDPKVFDILTADNTAALKIIFESKPKILKNISGECLEQLHLAAGTMLLGTDYALPTNLKTGLILDNVTAARMIMFYARNQVNLARYRESGTKYVKILIAGDGMTCDACQKLENKKFKIDEVIELPYEKCTCEIMGCRCVILPVI
jgi:hypothetical protein